MVYAQHRIRPGELGAQTSRCFEIQTHRLILATRSEIDIFNKKKKEEKTYRTVNFSVPDDHRRKLTENEKRDKYLDLARELKKTMEHESDNDKNCNRCTRYGYQRSVKGHENLEIRGHI